MTQPRIGNSELISAVNSRLVLQAVRRMQPTYRAVVARQTRLKPATVTGIVNTLLERNLVCESPAEAQPGSKGGRPPLMLRINGDARRILAIDLEPDCIRVALTNLLVEVVEYREQLTDRFSAPSLVLRQIGELCRQVLDGVDRSALLGAGVSLPGLVDREAGVLLSSTNMPKWLNVPIRDMIQKHVDLPVRIERSAHLAAIYEEWCTPDLADRTTLVLSLRTGLGMSLMHLGELYVGRDAFDGEIGHTIVDLNGELCECGNRGCLETFLRPAAILKRVQDMFDQGRGAKIRDAIDEGEPLRPELVYRLAQQGDADCIEIVRDLARYVGIAVANMVNVLAPHDVVICGSIDTADQTILDTVREQVDSLVLPKMREGIVIRLAKGKEKSPLLGAAVLMAKDLFSLPRLQHVGVELPAEQQALDSLGTA